MSGVVRDASYLGVSTQYIDRGAAEAPGSRSTSRTSSAPRKAELWAPGEEVQLTWSPDHTFVVADDGAPVAAAAS